MYELKKNGNVLTSKSLGTGPSSYEKRIYWAAVSRRLRNNVLGFITMAYHISPFLLPPASVDSFPLINQSLHTYPHHTGHLMRFRRIRNIAKSDC